MSNLSVPGNTQTPGQPSQNGQPNGAAGANNNTDDAPVVLSADDQAAQAAADAADAASAAANGEAPPDPGADGGGTPNLIPEPRFKEVIAERNAAMEFGRYWQDRALQMLAPGGGAGQPPGQPGAGAPGAGGAKAPPIVIDDPNDPQPTLAQHNFDAAKWSEASAAWTVRAIQRGVQQGVAHALTTRDQQTEAVTAQQAWNSRVQEFRTKNPDFDAVTRNPTLPVTDHMAAAIMRSEVGPALYHHLGKNPTEAARIARLSPAQQEVALARIEGRLSAAPAPGGAGGGGNGAAPAGARSAPGTPQRSQAPPPPNPTRAGAQGEVNLMNCSIDEYLAQRLPQIAASKGSRRSG